MKKGAIILIIFPFSDLLGTKLSPALVLAVSGAEVTVAFITTPLKWTEKTDVVLLPDHNNGIKKHSLIRISKVATLDKSLASGRLGYVCIQIQNLVDDQLRDYFQLK